MEHLFSAELLEVIYLSLAVSIIAISISAIISVPLGTLLGIYQFKGRSVIMRIIYTFMSLPPVLAGLIVYLAFSNMGLFGTLRWLYTPKVMIIAQVLLATPIIIGLTTAAVSNKTKDNWLTMLSLGASPKQGAVLIMKEARSGIISAVLTAFGRIFGEVGAVMLVGGNIRHSTRVLTTSIMLETRQGNFEPAILLGLVLLAISFIISSIILKYDSSKLK